MKKFLTFTLIAFFAGFAGAQASKISFPDVNQSDWFYNDVMNMAEWGVIQGNSDGTFAPSKGVNRAELSAMWNRYENHLKDVFYTKSEISAMMNTGTSVNDEEKLSTQKTSTESEDFKISNISVGDYWDNWDNDAEDDGFETNIYFKTADKKQIYPKVQDWTINVKLYTTYIDNSFKVIKDQLVYDKSFNKNQVQYESILATPFVRILKEDIKVIEDARKLGYMEITMTSDTYGTFSAYNESTRIYND